MRFIARQGLRWQSDNKARSGGDFGSPSNVEANWNPHWLDYLTLSVAVDNLWNDQFQELPGQRAADRSVFFVVRTVF